MISKIASRLRDLIQSGVTHVGQIAIQTNDRNSGFILSHEADVSVPDLESFSNPAAARELSTYADDGSYRFTKAQTNLRRGWRLTVNNEEELLQALDLFYPAAVGVYLAERAGRLEVENLRPKLERQTGMYRFARTISDAAAQKLVQEVCGPAHQCAKRILWQIDADTPLEPSPASLYNGIPADVPESAAIPLLCREACNHFVAECRKAAKAEAGK